MLPILSGCLLKEVNNCSVGVKRVYTFSLLPNQKNINLHDAWLFELIPLKGDINYLLAVKVVQTRVHANTQNMAKNTKTPIMVLQELAQKNHWSPPEYNIVNSIDGTHKNRFDFEVYVHNIVAKGTGASKQVGKQDAAFNALNILKNMNLYNESENPTQQFNGLVILDNPDSPINKFPSFIAPLRDLCCENKINDPVFTEISGTGPAHCREFTFECQIASVKTEATASTKKQAKQLAAQRMLERIQSIIPDLAKECEINFGTFIEESADIATKKFNELLLFDNVIENKSIKIKDFSDTIPNLLRERNLTFKDFEEEFRQRNIDALETILQSLELDYKICELQEEPIMVCLNLSTDTPFATVGIGPTKNEAIDAAVSLAFEILEFYIKSM